MANAWGVQPPKPTAWADEVEKEEDALGESDGRGPEFDGVCCAPALWALCTLQHRAGWSWEPAFGGGRGRPWQCQPCLAARPGPHPPPAPPRSAGAVFRPMKREEDDFPSLAVTKNVKARCGRRGCKLRGARAAQWRGATACWRPVRLAQPLRLPRPQESKKDKKAKQQKMSLTEFMKGGGSGRPVRAVLFCTGQARTPCQRSAGATLSSGEDGVLRGRCPPTCGGHTSISGRQGWRRCVGASRQRMRGRG